MDPLTDEEGLAYVFLKDFIKEGFPSPDPERQVALAHLYAQAWLKYKRDLAELLEKMPPRQCPKCQGELKQMDASTLDNPGAWQLICLNEKCRFVWPPTMKGEQE
jgi:hypothetical protein